MRAAGNHALTQPAALIHTRRWRVDSYLGVRAVHRIACSSQCSDEAIQS